MSNPENKSSSLHRIIEIPFLNIDHKELTEWILSPKGRQLIDREEWVDLHIQYNIFQQPLQQFYEIFRHIRNSFFSNLSELGGDNLMQYYIHGWCNIFEKSD